MKTAIFIILLAFIQLKAHCQDKTDSLNYYFDAGLVLESPPYGIAPTWGGEIENPTYNTSLRFQKAYRFGYGKLRNPTTLPRNLTLGDYEVTPTIDIMLVYSIKRKSKIPGLTKKPLLVSAGYSWEVKDTHVGPFVEHLLRAGIGRKISRFNVEFATYFYLRDFNFEPYLAARVFYKFKM